MNITKKTSTIHTTYIKGRTIKFILVHYTAGVTSKKGKALDVADMFTTSSRNASADFIVDDEMIVQYNPDVKNRYCWSVGGSKYSTLSTKLGGQYYGKATNRNTINIEMCSNKTNTKTLLDTDTDWYLTDKTMNNAIDLIKYLMETYGIDIDHVIMHHQVTGKLCPQPFCRNESALENWYSFKNKISEKTSNTTSTNNSTKISCLGKGDTGDSVKALQTNLNKILGTKLATDGCFGDATLSAVKSFQKKYSLTVDGLVGPATQSKIQEVLKTITDNTKTTTTTESSNCKVSSTIGVICYGNKGNNVKILQRALNKVLGLSLRIDGCFGANTLAAVKNFQTKRGLTVDGRVGPKTKEKFKSLGY